MCSVHWLAKAIIIDVIKLPSFCFTLLVFCLVLSCIKMQITSKTSQINEPNTGKQKLTWLDKYFILFFFSHSFKHFWFFFYKYSVHVCGVSWCVPLMWPFSQCVRNGNIWNWIRKRYEWYLKHNGLYIDLK